VKVFEISGKLYVRDEITHQEMLNILYKELTKYGIKFVGTTKDVTSEYAESEEYIRVY
jgi:hypothetical protein